MKTEIDDPVLGRLVLDGYYYNGTFAVAGEAGYFSIGTYQVQDVEARVERARAIHAALPSMIKRAKEYAVERLLPLKNDVWEEEDGRIIEASEFLGRIKISSVTLDHDATVVMYFDDGDLFFGHDILVTEKPDGTLDRAEIQG
jgi:hypothetical protein